MLGEVCEPDRVRSGGGEVALDEIVVHRRAGTLHTAAALAGGGRPQLLVSAQPPHSSFSDGVAGGFEFIGEEPVPELGVIGVGVDERVGQVGVGEIAVRTGPGAPLVERLG